MSPDERATLAALADVLVPGAERMPSASAVGVHERWLDRVLTARPDLAEPLRALLAGAEGRPAEEEVARLREHDLGAFQMLHGVVVAAYYLSPKVRRLVGYPGQRPHEVFDDQAEYDLRDGLLDPVLARGPMWRPPGNG